MKKLFLLVAIPATLIITSCGGSKTEEVVSIPGMTQTEITVSGNKLTVLAPDSTKGPMEIIEQSWGATEIKVGKGFQISIEESDGDIALMKSDIAGNDVNKFKRFIKDEPTLLFWESEITQPEFHFYMIVKVGEKSYLIQNIKDEMFDEKQAEAMIEAAKTLKAVETKPNS
jgi:hypothetical protein